MDEKLSNRAIRMFEQQERAKQILLKKYADQKERLGLQKDIETKIMKAESIKKKFE